MDTLLSFALVFLQSLSNHRELSRRRKVLEDAQQASDHRAGVVDPVPTGGSMSQPDQLKTDQ